VWRRRHFSLSSISAAAITLEPPRQSRRLSSCFASLPTRTTQPHLCGLQILQIMGVGSWTGVFGGKSCEPSRITIEVFTTIQPQFVMSYRHQSRGHILPIDYARALAAITISPSLNNVTAVRTALLIRSRCGWAALLDDPAHSTHPTGSSPPWNLDS
jgi:hypothetical protein